MMYDAIESTSLDKSVVSTNAKLDSFHNSFKSKLSPEKGSYVNTDNLSSENSALNAADLAEKKISTLDIVKKMYDNPGPNTNKNSDLKRINESYKKLDKNSEFYNSNVNQKAGYTAEVVSTAKENMDKSQIEKGIKTYRADDLSKADSEKYGLANKNDQYVDKVRIDKDGNVVERVQTKFVGKNASECYSKLKSKDFDKYFESSNTDKMEIPKDYYDEVKNDLIPKDLEKLNNQLERMKADGNTEEAAKLQESIDKIKKIDSKLEQSNTTKAEALFATKHPKLYTAKTMIASANKAGLKSAGEAAKLTAIISSADNALDYFQGEIDAWDAIQNVAKDTGVAGGVGYLTGAVSEITKSNVPAQVISFGVSSYGDVKAFINDDIGVGELLYDLGGNAFSVAGGVIGGAFLSVPGGIGGSMAARYAYEYTVDMIVENIDDIKEFASDTVDKVSDVASEAVDTVGDAIVDAKDTVVKVTDKAIDKAGDIIDSAGDAIGEAADTVKETVGDAVDAVGDVAGKAVDKTGKILGDAKESVGNAVDSVGDKLGSLKDSIFGD